MSIRLFAVPACLALAACTTTPPGPAVAIDCDATAVQAQLGQAATPAIVESARKVSGARHVRTIKPGQAVTMEFRADRLNLYLDDGLAIARASCG